MKFVLSEKIMLKQNCASTGNYLQPVLEAELEGRRQFFIFDSGSMITVLTDSTAVENFSKKKTASFGNYVSASGNKKKNRMFTTNVSTTLFESKNKVMLYSSLPRTRCTKKATIAGIIGLDAFFENDFSLFLNFSADEICNLDKSEFEMYKLKGFREIKSECKKNQIFVYLEIEGQLLKFKLDTGFTGTAVIPYDEKLQFANSNNMVLEGSFYGTISDMSIGTETLYEKMPVVFAGEKFEAKLNVSTSIKSQNLGIQFIKGFDWLIDYNNNKVYIKRSNKPIENKFNRTVTYYSSVSPSGLRISTKEKSQTKYKLGDQITSVNGEKVTSENICDLQDFLNKTEDWNTLNLEVTAK